jgi:CDP-diacylglycerol--serine O-phosphatidyltransferase
MIGYFDYSVWLTYCSLLSAAAGIFITFTGNGHPYIGAMFLLFSGLCDAFDGRVARTKKDRTQSQISYGIQIDSLSDLVAFGVLPACIGAALLRRTLMTEAADASRWCSITARIPIAVFIIVFAIYIMAAFIRLAWFNVTEEEMQRSGKKVREFYTGLPVTSAALIFPSFLLIEHFLSYDISFVYYILLLATAAAFVSKFKVKKPTSAGLLLMVGVGALEFAVILIIRMIMRHG